MCGIAGLVRLNDHVVPEHRVLRKMVSSIRHRGPDGDGYMTMAGVGFGHARLKIIDLAGGDQPIHNEDRTIWVSFNGEIFNYVELRRRLENAGHQFYTQSDTEVIVHLYEDFGDDFVHELNGQFAIALWDANRKRLLLIRDHVGILPLFYATTADSCWFSSEVKALLAGGAIEPRLDPSALDEVFTFWSPVAPRTMFSGVSQVCPGEMIAVESGRLHHKRYWDWTFPEKDELLDGDAASLAEELKERLQSATNLRLRADVPVGAYLSGGLDSSALTALVRNHGTRNLNTFSIGFDDRAVDETEYQQRVADWLHTDHRSLRCGDAEIAEQFVSSIWFTEVPVLRTSPTPMRLLSKLVRENGIKVILTGEGADEILGGYDIFKESKVREFWAKNPRSARRALLLRRLYPYLDFSERQNQSYLEAFFGRDLHRVGSLPFSHLPRWGVTSHIKLFYSDYLRRQQDTDVVQDFIDQAPSDWTGWHPFNRAEYVEARTLLPGYILSSQGDRMLMANSVEGRFPYLDPELISFTRRLHPKLKMRVLREKYLLKRAMSGDLPAEITQRFKQPYRAPNAKRIVNRADPGLASVLLSRRQIEDSGYFDADKVERLVKKIRRTRLLGERDSMAYFGILSTQAWHYLFADGHGVIDQPVHGPTENVFSGDAGNVN